METRFIKILTCKDCPFSRDVINYSRGNITYFCVNEENRKIEQLPAEVVDGTNYPIISVTRKDYDICSIPYWCTIPKEVK